MIKNIPPSTMDTDTFKLPTSLDGKHKFVARKTLATEKPPLLPAPDANAADAADSLPDQTQSPQLQTTTANETETVSASNDEATDVTVATQTPARQQQPLRPPQPPCPYTEPLWSAAPSDQHPYHIEMLKGGTIVETVSDLQSQPFWLIGKLKDNHIVMAHPTVSRFHAVLQYRPDVAPSDEPHDEKSSAPEKDASTPGKPRIQCGWYLYDLDSTHGSFVNKRRIPKRTYVRVRVGYMLSFGGSTRRLIVQGPDFDAEPEAELGITEQRELRQQKQAAEAELARAANEQRDEEERRREAAGASWGMQEDADEETDLSVNPYASTNNEELFLQDPKRTLRGYFEREGVDLEYRVDELSAGSFVCKIDLPISDSNGRPIRCEVSHKGKKKECVVQGALEACRILDRHGVLRQSHHESRKRKVEHSDSDGDDDFYDRTGAVQRRREQKDAVQQTAAYTYAELLDQERALLAKLADVNGRIETYQLAEQRTKQLQADGDAAADADDHDLDGFMAHLQSGGSVGAPSVDRTTIRRLRVAVKEIEIEHRQLRRLIGIARPADLPPLLADPAAGVEKKRLTLPLFGKRGTFKFASSAVVAAKPTAMGDSAGDVNEVEVDEDEPTPDAEPPVDEPTVEDNKLCKEPTESPLKQMVVDIPKPEGDNDNNGGPVETSESAEAAAAAKKKRSRPRIRSDRARGNIDMDEPAELAADADKYSTWVPPANQSGDGNTSLNNKFGY